MTVTAARPLAVKVDDVGFLSNETVHVYRPDRDVRRLSRGDTLDGEDVLPGFALPVDEICEV